MCPWFVKIPDFTLYVSTDYLIRQKKKPGKNNTVKTYVDIFFQ